MYTKHYNLDEKPFNITPDPKYLYLTESHREALSSMLYGVKERKGIISITGEVGTGKTTLIYSFLNSLDRNVHTVYIYHTNVTFEQILKKILIELNISSDQTDKTSLLQCFNDYLIEKLANDEIIAIIIDEAQNLSDNVLEELRMLTNLETSKSKLLQLILVGQPELEIKLNSENLRQLKQRISIRRQILPLTYDQSEEYIKHRINLAGCKSNIFYKKAISRICEHSKGIPRNINVICDNALLLGYANSDTKININIINEVIKDMDDIFILNPDYRSSENSMNNNYQTSNSSKYFRVIIFSLIILLISLILLINKNDILNQIYPLPAKYNSIGVSNDQHLTNALTPDKMFELNTAVSPRSNNLNTADKTETLTEKDEILETNTAVLSHVNNLNKVNKNSQLTTISNNISILDIRELQHKAIPDNSSNQNSMVTNINVNSENEHLDLIQTTKVKNGSSLFAITKEYYNNINITLAYIIFKANPKIKNIHYLKADQEIIIPRVTLETPLIKTSDNTYNIELGTFISLSEAKKYHRSSLLSGEKVKIIPRKVSLKDTWYQLILEKNGTKKDSLATVEALKEKGMLICFTSMNSNNTGTKKMLEI